MSISTSDVAVDSTVGLTDAELRAAPIDVNATFTPSGTQDVNIVSTIAIPVTDNSGSLTVDGTVSISGSVAVTGPLTDGQLRATPVPISGTVTATGPLTDTQLRATPVPISGTVSTTALVATTSNVTQVVTTNNTNATLLSANSARIKAIIFVAQSTVQIKLGAIASTTSFTYKVTSANTTIEITGYTGRIDAFGTGTTITITELS